MEGHKLDISGGKKSGDNSPTATYKPILETEMEEEALTRPKSLIKLKSDSPEADGADEKMLPKEDTKLTSNSHVNLSDVKISPSEKQNGDAQLDIGDLKPSFVGLTKEELMKYANDPFWVRLRTFLFVTFWILWAAMLVGAVLIIYAAPKCPAPEPRQWWEKGPLTEVPADTNLETLTSANLAKFKGFILPWTEDAYVVADDHHQIIKLLQDAKKNETKIILELDPSTSRVWFEQSEAKDPAVSDYYIWKEPKADIGTANPKPPNNWKKVHSNESAWQYSSKRKEFYYSPLGQPILNFRNDNVTDSFKNVIQTFLNKGAFGILLRNVANLLVDPKFEDEIPNNSPSVVKYGMMDYGFYTHTKTENLPELGPLLQKWKNVVNTPTNERPFIIKEELQNVQSYKVNSELMTDLPLLSHAFSKPVLNVSELVNSLNNSLYVDQIRWPLWKINTTAVPKDALDIVTYLLPGVPLAPREHEVNGALVNTRENSKSVMWGNCTYHAVANKTVFAFIREIVGSPGLLVALNPTDTRAVINIPKEIPLLSKLSEVTIHLYSSNYNETEYMDINAKKDASGVPLSPLSALVLSYVPQKD